MSWKSGYELEERISVLTACSQYIKQNNYAGSREQKTGHDLDLELKEAYEAGGAPQLRWQMNNIIVCLEYVYMMDRMDREPTYDE